MGHVSISKELGGGACVREGFARLDPPTDEARARARELAKYILDFTVQEPVVLDGAYMREERHLGCYVRGNSRDVMVAVYQEIAARLERGEIDGARAQYIDSHGGLRSRAEDGAIVSSLEYVVREEGRVRYVTAEIIEQAHNPPELVGATPAHLLPKRAARLAIVEG